MLADYFPAGGDQRTRCQGRCVHREMALQHRYVVIVGNEADLHRFLLIGGGESQPAGIGAGLLLAQLSNRSQHSRDHRPVDAPEKVALVLAPVACPVERSTPGNGVMASGDVVAVQRVRVGQQVPKLGEGIAAYAGNRRPPPAVLAHEVLDHVEIEPVFQVQNVVRNPQRGGHIAGIIDRVE
jgi:hypothetical protein